MSGIFHARFLSPTSYTCWKANSLSFVSDIQHELQQRYSTFFYIEQLKRHMDPILRSRKFKKRYLKGLLRLHDILQSLEVDLRTNSGE